MAAHNRHTHAALWRLKGTAYGYPSCCVEAFIKQGIAALYAGEDIPPGHFDPLDGRRLCQTCAARVGRFAIPYEKM